MSAQHTPGPWRVSELDASGNVSEYYLFIEPGVAVIERKVAGQDEHDMHDARLIAAAPELLEALRYCRNSLKAVIDGEGGIGLHAPEIIEADAAIAKATGQEGSAR